MKTLVPEIPALLASTCFHVITFFIDLEKHATLHFCALHSDYRYGPFGFKEISTEATQSPSFNSQLRTLW